MGNETGKPFEAKIARWLDNLGLYYERFFDARSVGGVSAPRPADFFIYHKRQLYYIECKHISRKSIPIKNLTQLKRLYELQIKHDVISYFLIEYGKTTYSIATTALYEWVIANMQEIKSVSEKVAKQLGHELKGSTCFKEYCISKK